MHGHDDAAASGDDDTAMDCCAGLQTLPPSPVPVPKREWKWKSPAKRQATLAASSSSSARPTDSLQAEPIEEVHTDAAIVAIESETVSVPAEAVENPMVPASELANPVPLQPAVPDLEPPAEVAAAAAGRGSCSAQGQGFQQLFTFSLLVCSPCQTQSHFLYILYVLLIFVY